MNLQQNAGAEEEKLLVGSTPRISLSTKRVRLLYAIVAVIAAFAIALVVGLLIGWAAFRGGATQSSPVLRSQNQWGATVDDGGTSISVFSWIDDQLRAANIQSNLQTLTVLPHIAGSTQNMKLAEDIYTQWVNYGFDDVQLVNYSVLLSYPNTSNPNKLLLKNGAGDTIYTSQIVQEQPLTSGEDDSTVAPPFFSYSGVGNATGKLVYVNYATFDDFTYLTKNLSLNLTGHICICKLGGIYRGDKARMAQSYGCSALIVYLDPIDFIEPGQAVYPNGRSMPPSGNVRGTLLETVGDPLTNLVPSLEGVFRESYSSVLSSQAAPSIPVQPIGYGDAFYFMSQLDTTDVPVDWIGGLNVTYRIRQSDSNTNQTFIQVNNYQEQRYIYDVIGTIYGQVEPDQMVILGNHRDAWVFGAIDPSSGTAVMQEMARVLGTLRSKGWRPGRTIMLCSWDSEEYGLMGSTEWVEEMEKVIGPNAVAYINSDLSSDGNLSLSAAATPLLYNPLFTAAKMVKCPNPSFNTLYDEWLYWDNVTLNGTAIPYTYYPGSATDYTMFIQLLGISVSDVRYAGCCGYPVYHSVHDNYYWATKFGASFEYYKASGLMWFKTALLIATSPVLPYDPRYYATSLQRDFGDFKQQYDDVLQSQNISLKYIADELEQFISASITFWNQLQTAASNTSISERALRILNNKLMNLERAFILPEGLPGSQYKHVLFAPSAVNSNSADTFPGLSDAISNALNTPPSSPADWDEVRRQYDIIRVHIRYATQVMMQPGLEFLT